MRSQMLVTTPKKSFLQCISFWVCMECWKFNFTQLFLSLDQQAEVIEFAAISYFRILEYEEQLENVPILKL